MNGDSYREALNQARLELAEINKQMEILYRRKEQLQNIAKVLAPLALEGATLELEFPSRPVAPGDDSNARKSPNGTRDLIISAIRSAGRPLTALEIRDYAQRLMPQYAPAADAIRIMMRRRIDTFVAVGGGRYALSDTFSKAGSGTEAEPTISR